MVDLLYYLTAITFVSSASIRNGCYSIISDFPYAYSQGNIGSAFPSYHPTELGVIIDVRVYNQIDTCVCSEEEYDLKHLLI